MRKIKRLCIRAKHVEIDATKEENGLLYLVISDADADDILDAADSVEQGNHELCAPTSYVTPH